MIEKIKEWSGVVALVILAIMILPSLFTNPTFGGGTRYPNGISADTTSPVAGEVRGTDLTITDDATISGGVLNVPTAANATSTATVGCVNSYPTSSATVIHLAYNTTSSTSTVEGQSNGMVGFKYGICP